jgi:glycosyltransferase involved in cell wall biosynthesis
VLLVPASPGILNPRTCGHAGRGINHLGSADVAERPPSPDEAPGAPADGAPSSRPPGKVVVVMPAWNAARTLERTFAAIPQDWVDEIILVDDRSTDDTVALARALPLRLVWHPHNVGYGGNQKTCYLQALQLEADAVVMLHPDGQYEPTLIPKLVEPILSGRADLVLGSRLAEKGGWRKGGMPLHKYLANRGLTAIENRVLRTRFSELHTGYRAYSKNLLEGVPFLRNSLDFSFDSELLFQAVHFGYRVIEIPTPTKYFDDASSIELRAASVYAVKTLWTALRLVLHRHGILRSAKFVP